MFCDAWDDDWNTNDDFHSGILSPNTQGIHLQKSVGCQSEINLWKSCSCWILFFQNIPMTSSKQNWNHFLHIIYTVSINANIIKVCFQPTGQSKQGYTGWVPSSPVSWQRNVISQSTRISCGRLWTVYELFELDKDHQLSQVSQDWLDLQIKAQIPSKS